MHKTTRGTVHTPNATVDGSFMFQSEVANGTGGNYYLISGLICSIINNLPLVVLILGPSFSETLMPIDRLDKDYMGYGVC